MRSPCVPLQHTAQSDCQTALYAAENVRQRLGFFDRLRLVVLTLAAGRAGVLLPAFFFSRFYSTRHISGSVTMENTVVANTMPAA